MFDATQLSRCGVGCSSPTQHIEEDSLSKPLRVSLLTSEWKLVAGPFWFSFFGREPTVFPPWVCSFFLFAWSILHNLIESGLQDLEVRGKVFCTAKKQRSGPERKKEKVAAFSEVGNCGANSFAAFFTFCVFRWHSACPLLHFPPAAGVHIRAAAW